MTPWFGLHLPYYTFDETPPERLFDRIVEQARAAELAGFSLVTVMDHLYQINGVGPVTDPMLEGWSVLAALARETSRVRLGTLVTGVTYRNPALLAKTATTLDVLSGGRAIFGLGAAWNEDEHIGYGFDFPPIRERMDRLDEALTIAKLMFGALAEPAASPSNRDRLCLLIAPSAQQDQYWHLSFVELQQMTPHAFARSPVLRTSNMCRASDASRRQCWLTLPRKLPRDAS